MRLHIDGIIFSLQHHGGISVYFRELLSRLSPEHQATLTIESPSQRRFDAQSYPNVRCVERPGRTLERLRTARGIGAEPSTIFHSTYYRQPARADQPSVVTVHDFVYQRLVSGPLGWMKRWLMNGAIAQARHIICISESTRQDLYEFSPVRSDQQVSVIYNGVSDVFRPLSVDDPSRLANGPAERPFMLFVGQRAGYKNFSHALRVLELLPDLELHCVGGGALKDEEFSGVSESTRRRVRHRGFIDDEQLNALYNDAHCLLYPSKYEGFGIPVLEAMRAGCPAVSIDCKAVVEVGDSALTVAEDSEDPRALARAVEYVGQPDARARLRELGLVRGQQFSWDRCFQQTLDVYQSL